MMADLKLNAVFFPLNYLTNSQWKNFINIAAIYFHCANLIKEIEAVSELWQSNLNLFK